MSSEITGTVVSYITSPGALWALFGVVVGLVATISFILHYHWRHYGVNRRVITRAQFVYFVGTGVLLAGAFFSLSGYFVLSMY
ncbi:MAG: hypothetical protein WD049_03800 [Candidatus Paceibacterota bacterium]